MSPELMAAIMKVERDALVIIDIYLDLYAALDSVMREIVGDDFEGNTETERKVVSDAWAALRKARGEQ